MIPIKIVVLAVAGLVLLMLVKQNSPPITILAEVAIVFVVIMTIIPEAEKLLSLFDNVQDMTYVSESALKILFKSFGLLAVGAIVSDVCRDNGAGAIAGVVELSVKILAVSCALPVFSAVVEIALTLFNR